MFNANHVDSGRIWVYTVCGCSFYEMLGENGLIACIYKAANFRDFLFAFLHTSSFNIMKHFSFQFRVNPFSEGHSKILDKVGSHEILSLN